MMIIIISALLVSAIIYNLLLWIKTDNAFKNQVKILNAIDCYATEVKDYDKALFLMYSMESLSETIYRFTDWGYKNILPKEYFELIEPYIQ